jgi:hypothetical protein
MGDSTEASQMPTQPEGQSEDSQLETPVLLALYEAAMSQNQLYADFRFKVFGFLTTLQAALLYAVTRAAMGPDRILLAVVGLIIATVLWAMEKRHHTIFSQSRNAASEIEKHLKAQDLGVFSWQLRGKRGLGHRAIVNLSSLLIGLGWCAVIVVSIPS